MGLDIAAPEGAPVKAPADGKVALTHPGMFFNGKTIILDHGLSLSSIYVHLSEVSVATGEIVDKGQVIGKVGKTGRATGPHVHWGVLWEGVDLDPFLLVTKAKLSIFFDQSGQRLWTHNHCSGRALIQLPNCWFTSVIIANMSDFLSPVFGLSRGG